MPSERRHGDERPATQLDPVVEVEEERLAQQVSMLTALVADLELELQTLELELSETARRLAVELGHLLERRAQLLAALARREARLHPDDAAFRRRAEEAEEEARRAREEKESARRLTKRAAPSPEAAERLKALYRRCARAAHPDHGMDEADRQRRHEVMAEVNECYRRADIDGLEAIWRTLELGSRHVEGRSDLLVLKERVARLESRVRDLHEALDLHRSSDLYVMHVRLVSSDEEGRDLLQELRSNLRLELRTLSDQLEPTV